MGLRAFQTVFGVLERTGRRPAGVKANGFTPDADATGEALIASSGPRGPEPSERGRGRKRAADDSWTRTNLTRARASLATNMQVYEKD